MSKKPSPTYPGLVLKDTRNVAIVYRGHTAAPLKAAQKLTQWLKKKKYNVFTAPEQKLISETILVKTKKQLDDLSLVVVLGGDGTYLRAVRILAGRQIPILGFNMGSLGFLTNHSVDELCEMVEKTLDQKMHLQSRSMLLTEVHRNSKLRGQFLALNDVVIERGQQSQLINTAIYSEKTLVSAVKADGIIISSPTGSTAYNLAAGGPILDPEVKAIVVTPIAPHALTSRPLIFPDHRTLSFRLNGKPHHGNLIVDGQKQLEITNDDVVFIRRDPHDHWLVRAPNHNFYHLLREKLKFGDRS